MAIRDFADTHVPAVRALLPAYDEGIDLRVGWLDPFGRAHWEYPVCGSGDSGDGADGEFGPSLQVTYCLPPQFDTVTLIFAWPEIGFPETTVTLALPDQRSVEEATVAVWEAPMPTSARPSWHNVAMTSDLPRRVRDETGVILTPPQVLLRNDDAVLLLTRLCAHEDVLRATLIALARGATADSLRAWASSERCDSSAGIEPTSRTGGPVIGLVNGNILDLSRFDGSEMSTGSGAFKMSSTWSLPRPALMGPVRFGAGWQLAGLEDKEIILDLGKLG